MVAHPQKGEFGVVGFRVLGDKPFQSTGENQRKTERTCIPWALALKFPSYIPVSYTHLTLPTSDLV